MLAVNATPDTTSNRNVPAATKGKSKKPEKSDDEIAIEGLMTEIEADLRGEEIDKLWKKYGIVIIAAAVGIVIAVAGWQLWRQDIEQKKVAAAKQYEVATKLIQDGKLEDAATAFALIADQKGQGYAALAQLQKATIALNKNDLPGALAAYKALAGDDKADVLFRDLAKVLRVMHGLDSENPLELESALKPLLDPANPFVNSATELTALLAYKQGDGARAQKLAEGLANDQRAPAALRQRAEELAAVFAETVPASPAPAAK
jgi:hypothetical protein